MTQNKTDMRNYKTEYSGILLAILATFLMTLMSASIHALGNRVPLGQIIFWRSSIALIPICVFLILQQKFPMGLSTQRPRLHFVRSIIGVVSMAFSFLSLAYLSVTMATFFVYLIPVLIVPVATMTLGEKLRPTTLLATIGAFFAASLILLPNSKSGIVPNMMLWGILAGLGYTLTMVFVKVHVKKMTATETPESIAFYFALTGAIAGLLTLPFGWINPSPQIWGLLISSGLLGGAGHAISIHATARSRLSSLAPVEFSGMAWAILLDILLFSNIPNRITLIGAALILLVAWWSINSARI